MVNVEARSRPLAIMRAVFLGTLGAGVALYGGTQAATEGLLEDSLLCVVSAYVLARILAGSPSVDWKSPVPLLALVLLSAGWLSAVLPISVYSQEYRAFLPLQGQSWWRWGSVDGDTSQTAMVRLTGMVGVLYIASDMGRNAFWRKALVITVVTIAVSVALLGLLQRGLGDIGGYWGEAKLGFAFGPFWYHANAGAFLNLCWPLVAGGLILSVGRLETARVSSQIYLSLWLLALIVMAMAVFVNVSKAAQAISILQLAVMGWVAFHQQPIVGKIKSGHLLLIGIFIILLAAMLYMFGLQRGIDRWEHLMEKNFHDLRWRMAAILLPWVKEAGVLGFGPGTFSAVYVVKSTDMPGAPGGFWRFAHNDYLQTLLEWGWLGTALWLALAASILWRILKKVDQSLKAADRTRFLWHGPLLVALTATGIHAALDFPLQIYAIQLFVATLSGLALADGHRPERGVDPVARRRRMHGDLSSLKLGEG